MLLQQFQKHINNKKWFNTDSKLLLAVSGGRDSMVLADLIEKSNLTFSVAHCNFCLRNNEANRDEEFVLDYFGNKNTKVFSRKFNTAEYANKKKLSIQMAARELRYNWFKELRNEFHFDYLITAHHLNDTIETFFINLFRGTGINGLKGIPEQQEWIIRPLLFATTDEITSYQKENNIPFVEDSSNRETKYLRNQLRHQLIPIIKTINPELEYTLKKEISIFSDVAKYVDYKMQQELNSVTLIENNQFIIKISELTQLPFLDLTLHYLLQRYYFSSELTFQLKEMIFNPQSGKKISGTKFTCLIDRGRIIFSENKINSLSDTFNISLHDKQINNPIFLKLNFHSGAYINKSQKFGCFDIGKLTFPLQLRKWENGDYYYPIGMNGKKKLSDFFVNNKYSEFEKKEQWLLTTNNQIIWIVGKRIDKRFMVTDNTTETLEISLDES